MAKISKITNKNSVQTGFGRGRAKKSLGQNFLKSGAIVKRIVAAGEIQKGDTVLEIGPGKGILTEKLLSAVQTGFGRVIAVEKDDSLFEFLSQKFAENIQNGTLALLNKDILEYDPDSIPGSYKIIANIPYNITGAIFKKFLTAKKQPKLMVLMVQKEVASRILANKNGVQTGFGRVGGGKGSLLGLGVWAYGEPKMVAKVPARYFSPAPKVDSAVISIKNISRKLFQDHKVDENRFWEIVRAGFSHKRKFLASNLKTSLSQSSSKPGLDRVEEVLEGSGISPKARAEDLSLEKWITLAQKLV